ncbi:MAG: hypothetical protein HYR84_00115 [Planctomycetes bacterium]|nr:hypothetical protein [Planctomycetota bacterium]
MRRSILLSALAVLIASAPSWAQGVAGEQVVVVKDVEVRSGPSKNFYPTLKLMQNDKVLVLRESKESPGWLEIKPPPGSFSWVNAKYVKQVDARHGFVDCDPARPVSVLPGSSLVNQEPNRESMKLTAGTVVVIVAQPLAVNGETWLPIQPHPSEVRYLPAEAVKAAAVITPQPTNGPPNWTLSPNGYSGNNVLAEAEKALTANDIGRARQLFQVVANNATDQNQKVYALNRLDALSRTPVNATTTSLSPAAPAPAAAANLVTLQPAAWSVYGRLRDTKLLSENGQPLYALEDGLGKTAAYVTNQPGKSLQAYVGRTVAVFGPTMYRPDSAVRMQFVVATHVAVP